MQYLILIVGFVLLIKGADFFVDGSSSLARIAKVPPIIIGLTIVAMGTSAPEAAVSISAGIKGSQAIALNNIIGSNIFNLLMVIGICSLFYAIPSSKDVMRRDLPVNVAVAALLLILMLDGSIGLADGIILLVFFIAYMAYLVIVAIKSKEQPDEQIKTLSLPRSLIYIIIGLAAVIFGGNLVVNSSCEIARSIGISEGFIGLTIIALGTSLPELVTSIVAAKKGETDLAMGNVLGSNCFNILFILGTTSVIRTISGINTTSLITVGFLIFITLLTGTFLLFSKKITKWQGAVMILLYFASMTYNYFN